MNSIFDEDWGIVSKAKALEWLVSKAGNKVQYGNPNCYDWSEIVWNGEPLISLPVEVLEATEFRIRTAIKWIEIEWYDAMNIIVNDPSAKVQFKGPTNQHAWCDVKGKDNVAEDKSCYWAMKQKWRIPKEGVQ